MNEYHDDDEEYVQPKGSYNRPHRTQFVVTSVDARFHFARIANLERLDKKRQARWRAAYSHWLNSLQGNLNP